MRILILVTFLVGYSATAGAQENFEDGIVGTWISDTSYWISYYKFNKDGSLLETMVSKKDKKEIKKSGAYIFQKNYCWVANRNQNKSFGNMMLYQGSSHCCYRANFIADMLIMTSADGGNTCTNQTLKRQE